MSVTLADIRRECRAGSPYSIEYEQRMLHAVPDAPVVDRVQYIVDACRDKTVLHCGCVGKGSPVHLHDHVKQVACKVYGIDREGSADVNLVMDFDDPVIPLPVDDWDIELVLVPELLEHLTNPGRFLDALHVCRCPLLITVPNAFSSAAMRHMRRGVENVNKEHVAYYSYWTLRRLVTMCGYRIAEWRWYHGQPRTAEGLLFVVRGSDE